MHNFTLHEKPTLGGNGRILLMDDDKFLSLLTVELLNNIGYHVALAANGEKAISLYKKAKESDRPFDLVILDINIRNGMGGRETMNHLLQIDPGIRAIVSSAYIEDPLMVDFRDYGFSGALPKPFGVRELHDTVSRVMTD